MKNKAGGDKDHCNDNLNEQLVNRPETLHVINEAKQQDKRQRGQRATDNSPYTCNIAPSGNEGRDGQRGKHAQYERDPAEVRNHADMNAAAIGLVTDGKTNRHVANERRHYDADDESDAERR